MPNVTSALMDKAKAALSSVKLDNDGLDLFRVNLRKDPNKSRALLRISTEIGIDLPGDMMEDTLVMIVSALTSGTATGNEA
jgi:hypothetical protein